MKKVLMQKREMPLLSSLRRKQKKLWKSTTAVVVLLFYENDRASDISKILLDILGAFDNGTCGYLVRYISTTKNIIDSLENELANTGLESYRYHIRFGLISSLECLLTTSTDVLSIRPLIELWDSSEGFDLFLLPGHRLKE